MSERVPCKVCGVTILPETAERTGGFCMQCVEDPSGRSSTKPPPPPPAAELLAKLKPALAEGLLSAARTAIAELSDEGIYGFALYHGQFLYANATVFTEAGLDKKVLEYGQRGYTTSREALRWSPCDSAHHVYAESAFSEVEEIFTDLDQHPQGDFVTEIECIFLSCLDELRAASIFPPTTVVTLMEGDQSHESRLAYAELFNLPETVDRFKGELFGPNPIKEAHLAHYRGVIPNFRDA